MGLAGVGLAVAIGSLGYGIYAGEEAQAQQKRAIKQAQDEFNQQQNTQQKQYQDQLAAEKATTAQNLATEAQTKADTQAAQQQALAAEQAAIGTNSTTLSNSLNAQNTQMFKDQQPLIQQHLNASGLANSGAYAAQLAKYQAQLASQAQSQLANYKIGAQGQLTQNTNAASAAQVQLAEQNALLNIQNGEQNMSQNFATTDANNQNNTAYQQYITGLQSAQASSAAQQAAGYTGLAGSLGGGLINYYGAQNNPYYGSQYNPALTAFHEAGYGSGPNQGLGPSWNGGHIGGTGFAG